MLKKEVRLIDANNLQLHRYNSYAEAIKNAPTIDPESLRPQWISVEDRLPDTIPCATGTEYSEAVIVWTDGKKAMIAVWNGSRFLCAADYWEAWGEKITHWMPLPNPPEKQ